MINFIIFFFISFVPLAVAETQDADFNLEMSSLMNQTRAYELRAKSLDRLVSRYPDKTFPILTSFITDSSENASLRYLAADKLRISSEAQLIFLKILDDPKQDVLARRIALAQLVQINKPPLRKKVLEILDRPKEDPAIRQYALAVFSGWPEKDKIERLRNFVQSSGEFLNMRTNALFLLESLGDLDFVRLQVHQFLSDQKAPEELRKNCIVMTERLKDEKFVPLLMRIAGDSHESSSLRQLAGATLTRMNRHNIS